LHFACLRPLLSPSVPGYKSLPKLPHQKFAPLFFWVPHSSSAIPLTFPPSSCYKPFFTQARFKGRYRYYPHNVLTTARYLILNRATIFSPFSSTHRPAYTRNNFSPSRLPRRSPQTSRSPEINNQADYVPPSLSCPRQGQILGILSHIFAPQSTLTATTKPVWMLLLCPFWLPTAPLTCHNPRVKLSYSFPNTVHSEDYFLKSCVLSFTPTRFFPT